MLTNRRRHKKRIESLAGHVAVRPSTTQQRYQVVSWTGTRSFSETQDTGVLLLAGADLYFQLMRNLAAGFKSCLAMAS